MNQSFEHLDLGAGVALHGLETDKFKTLCIHAVFQAPLDERAPQISLIPAIIRRGTRSYPDLVTLDLQMPGHSGLLFYRQLKKRPAYRDLPVIVISGFAGSDLDREKFVKHFLEPDHIPHPDAYLDKPLEQDDFLRAVGDILTGTGKQSGD